MRWTRASNSSSELAVEVRRRFRESGSVAVGHQIERFTQEARTLSVVEFIAPACFDIDLVGDVPALLEHLYRRTKVASEQPLSSTPAPY